MKIAILSPKNRTVYNFRGDLIKQLIANGHAVTVTGPNNIDVEKIRALGADFVSVPLEKSGINPFNDINYYAKLKRFIKAYQPDITFGYTIKPVIYGALASKRCGVGHIVSMVTGVGYLFAASTFKARMLRIVAKALYKLAFKAAHAVIFQNPDDKQEFVDNRLLGADKCHLVNGSGVNMAHFAPASLPKQLTFFMLSRVMKAKGINEYLAAATAVKKQYPKARFMLLGACEGTHDSINKDELQTYVDDGIIDYYGETDDVRTYYKQCSVFVLPSYREGTPRTVLEAMAMKRPIVTTDTPGCRETVVDEKTGFLVAVRDVDALTDRMIWFVNNKTQVKTMGEASYALCQKKFEVGKVNQAMIKILKAE